MVSNLPPNGYRTRKTLIAEGALSLLSKHGSHGLTHRAVDALLELPAGSTSYYFSSRLALLCAAADCLFEQDRTDVLTFWDRDGELDVKALVSAWSSPPWHPRLLARLELCLEAARNPQMQQHLLSQREFYRNELYAMMERRGNDDPLKAADQELALAAGELLHKAVFDMQPATQQQTRRKTTGPETRPKGNSSKQY